MINNPLLVVYNNTGLFLHSQGVPLQASYSSAPCGLLFRRQEEESAPIWDITNPVTKKKKKKMKILLNHTTALRLQL